MEKSADLERELRFAAEQEAQAQRRMEGVLRGDEAAAAGERLLAARSLRRAIEGEMNDLARLRACLGALLEKLDRAERQVMRLRYEQGRSWVQVGMMMGCDEATARRIERRCADYIAENIALDRPAAID